MSKKSLFLLAAVPLLGACFSLPSHAQPSAPRYTIIDLGALGCGDSFAYGINDKGQVVGTHTVTSATHPFIYSNGKISTLDTVIGDAFSINTREQVVGFSETELLLTGAQTSKPNHLSQSFQIPPKFHMIDFAPKIFSQHDAFKPMPMVTLGGPPPRFAYMHSDGKSFTLSMLPGGTTSAAESLNDNGQAVGYADTTISGQQQQHAVLWQDGVIHDLGTLPGDYASCATAINSLGDSTGTSTSMQLGIGNRAFYCHNGEMHEIGLPKDDTQSFGTGINSLGDICGYGQQDHPFKITAFVYKQGELNTLKTLGGRVSIAMSINNQNSIVGMAETPTGQRHAVLWSHGEICDLNEALGSHSHLMLEDARAINNRGQIVGMGEYIGKDKQFGARHAYLLTPAVNAEYD